eukprot:gene11794-2170_t
MANRFRVMLTKIMLEPEKAKQIVLAICCLHNMLIDEQPSYKNACDSERDNHELFQGSWRLDKSLTELQKTKNRNCSLSAKGQRELLKQYFCSTSGSVSWQDSMSNEVASSYHMELEELTRIIARRKGSELGISAIVTDGHKSIQKWLKDNCHSVNRYLDVWHVAKGKLKGQGGRNSGSPAARFSFKKRKCFEAVACVDKITNQLILSAHEEGAFLMEDHAFLASLSFEAVESYKKGQRVAAVLAEASVAARTNKPASFQSLLALASAIQQPIEAYYPIQILILDKLV